MIIPRSEATAPQFRAPLTDFPTDRRSEAADYRKASGGGAVASERGPWCGRCCHEYRSKDGVPEKILPECVCPYCGEDDPFAITSEKPFHEMSKSQYETHALCNRRWYYKYIAKLPDPPTKYSAFGIAAHKVAEEWLKTGALPVLNSLAPKSQESRIAESLYGGIPHMPDQHHPGLQVEREFHYLFSGVHYAGFMDYTGPTAHPFISGTPWPLVGDHKFTGSLKYVPTVAELENDLQFSLYAYDWMRKDERIENVVANWVYMPRGSRGAMPVRAIVNREQVTKRLQGISPCANKLIALRSEKGLTPGDFSIANRREDACTAYGAPCPFLNECEKVGDNNPAEQIGDLGEEIMTIEGNANGGLAGILATMPQNAPQNGAIGAPAARPLWAGQVPLATGVNPPPMESAPKAATPPPPPAPPAAPPAPPGASDGVPRGFIRVSIPGMAEPVTLPANMENNLPPGSAVVARGDAAPPIPATAPKGLPNAVPPGEYVVAPKAAGPVTSQGVGAHGPATIVAQAGAPKRKGGRPPGSLNKTKIVTVRPPTGTPPGTPFEVSAPPGTKVVIQPAKEPTVKPGAIMQYTPIAEMHGAGTPPRIVDMLTPHPMAAGANAFHLYINTLPTKAPGMTVVSATDLLSQVLPKLCREMNVAHYKAIDYGKSTAALASYTEAYLMQNPLGENVIVTVQTSTQEGSDVCATLERLALRVSRGTL